MTIRIWKTKRILLSGLLLFTIHTTNLLANDYFVSPTGQDNNPGTFERPFATLTKAASMLEPGDTCYLRQGVYRETLRPEQSGEEGQPITFRNWQDEQVVISGTDILSEWQNDGDGTCSASMPWSLGDDNQFFHDTNDQDLFLNQRRFYRLSVGGLMLSEACWPAPGDEPLFNPGRSVASGGSPTTLVCEQLTGADDSWVGAKLWCAGGSAWICWTSEVTGYDADTHTLTFKDSQGSWYTPRAGNLFILKGLRSSLKEPGQWYYDSNSQRVSIVPPEDSDVGKLVVEAKRRIDAIDLSGRAYINIQGLRFHAAGIRTDENSSHLRLKNLQGRYVAHSNRNDVSATAGVLIRGSDNLLMNCDLGYSSSSVVNVQGSDHRIINNYIHHGGYIGLWRGAVVLSGRRILFSHNTVKHAGRDLVNTHGLMESLVQYNDVSEAGWLTKDLGMFYGHNTDFANTVFRYNLVHDNHAEHCSMGIYFDHLSNNAIVHHNVVWNVGMDPIRINNPSYGCLVFNNTCFNSGKIGTFDHSKRDDMLDSRFFNNIFNERIDLPEHVTTYGNQIIDAPQFVAADQHDFRLNNATDNTIGAYAPDATHWTAGCNLASPPTPLPCYESPQIDWMNMVRNSCFELGSLESWQKTDAKNAEIVSGNGWGNHFGNNSEVQATGTSKYELRLGPGRDGASQTIRGLNPGTTYRLSAWCKVSDSNQVATLGVTQNNENELVATSSSSDWQRLSVEFTTDSDATEVEIFILNSTSGELGDGYAWFDNLTLPLTPQE
jgi:hypothetical protein